MIRKYRWTLIVTSLITILPMLAGLLLWNELPDTIATHFGSDGEPNGWSSKPMAVFGIPLIMLALHLLCSIMTMNDPKRQNINPKIMKLLLWICPVLSIFVTGTILPLGVGIDLMSGDIILVCVSVLVGVIFIVIGNYLPKVKQNYTVGIKISWTLSDEDNWNATHRVGGKVWVIGGILILLSGFTGQGWLLMTATAAMVAIPLTYSFIYHIRHK